MMIILVCVALGGIVCGVHAATRDFATDAAVIADSLFGMLLGVLVGVAAAVL